MKTLSGVLLVMLITAAVHGQCLTDFTKLVPEPSLDYSFGVGYSVSMYDDYLAVGMPNSDSLGRLTGIVFIFEKFADGWMKIATLSPSAPVDALQFGVSVKMSKDYLLVTAGNYGGRVYLFKKPASGWTSQTELTVFTVPKSQWFGYVYGNQLEISDDQNTIAICDGEYREFPVTADGSGAVFIFHKQSTEEWSNAITPTVVTVTDEEADALGRGGIDLHGDRIAISTPFAPTGNGRIYIFRDPSGQFSNFILEAKLQSGDVSESSFLGIYNFVFTDAGIFASATADFNTPKAKFGIVFFEKPASGLWTDMQRTCFIDPNGNTDYPDDVPLRLSTNGEDIFVASQDTTNTGFFTRLKKGPSGWCNPEWETLDVSVSAIRQRHGSHYSYLNACNQHANAVVGMVPHPENPLAEVALKIFSKNPEGSWEKALLYAGKKSTAGHYYGYDILGFEDYLFVTAPADGTVKANGGAVYSYKKLGDQWEKAGKLTAPDPDYYDNGFGSALAYNGQQLAIGAAGYEPHGRIFIYESAGGDWSQPQLVQEVSIPEQGLTVFAYGDNLAMSQNWLIVPYVQNDPARIMLAIFKKSERSLGIPPGDGSRNCKYFFEVFNSSS